MTDMTEPDNDAPVSLARYYGHVIVWSAGLSFVIIGLVVAAAAAGNLFENFRGGEDWALLAGGLAVVGALIVPLRRNFPDFTQGEPDTPRGLKKRRLLWLVLLIGLLAALPLSISDINSGDHLSLFDNGPVPALAAIATIFVWGLLMPVLAVYARNTADEVARAARDFGMMLGFTAFTWVAPMWWFGWRGGFFPQPDVMILFVMALVITTLAQIWKQAH